MNHKPTLPGNPYDSGFSRNVLGDPGEAAAVEDAVNALAAVHHLGNTQICSEAGMTIGVAARQPGSGADPVEHPRGGLACRLI